MTEEEWNACAGPKAMLEFMEGKASSRKLRLFAVACCRSVWDLLKDPRSRMAVAVLERHADSGGADITLEAAARDAHQAAQENDLSDNSYASWTAANAIGAGQVDDADEDEHNLVSHDPFVAAQDTAFCAAWTIAQHYHPGDSGDLWYAATQAHEVAECRLLRDVVGNPFRPIAIDPAWNTRPVVQLAQAIYEERAFDRLPILADALEDAGCTHPDILAHCRGPGPHVRGCWVVDLLTGRQ